MLSPLHPVARQHLAHRLDQLLLRHRELGLRLLLEIIVALLGEPGELGADDQVLDLHLALLFLVAALDDDARAAAAVGVFHLRAELARAEKALGPDAGGAQTAITASLAALADTFAVCW
jgi:hypothetical protein